MDFNALIPYALAYLAGAFPTSIVTCRLLKGIDIRAFGSGNAGATNVYRVMGLKVALFVLLIDALKGVLGVYLPRWFLENATIWHVIAGGLTAILGHVFTIFAGFRGGKGVGTALGVFMAIMPCPALVAFAVWSVVLVLTRIVSVASMSAGAALALAALLFFKFGLTGIEPPLVYFAAAAAALIIITHRSNIIRLVHGTESRIQFRPGKKEPASTGRPS